MSFSVSGTRLGSAVAAVGSKAVAVQPVQPVSGDRPPPDRRFDATAPKTKSGGLAAMVLQRGGGPSPESPSPAAGGTAGETAPAVKPNLDALNRVLAHYVAQTAAAVRLRP